MKILIVSGFLGAGKTTFIKALAKHTGKDFAILENEYGTAGIDADRLRAEEGQSPVNIWEMTEGCICCSAKGDFSLSVLSIANTIDPEYLVIEPTGVGMLGNVLENVKKIEYQRISILSPVTIADIYSCRRYLKEYPALYENQIREAGTIFLSKSEQASPEEKEEARQILTKINPTATIYTDHYSSLPEKDWLHTSSAFWIICILYFWKFVGYYIFIYSSRLQMIPKEYYEYASLHGAGKWQSFYYITCPILFPVILFTLILSIMNAFKCYREAFLLGGTHPDNSIYFLQHFMNNNLQNLNYQKVSASATSMLRPLECARATSSLVFSTFYSME